jgi:hypothetical protein
LAVLCVAVAAINLDSAVANVTLPSLVRHRQLGLPPVRLLTEPWAALPPAASRTASTGGSSISAFGADVGLLALLS